MKNIFKDAKFGDKFVTRNGNVALYISSADYYFDETVGSHELEVQYFGKCCYFDNGKNIESWDLKSKYEEIPESDLDIVSKYLDNSFQDGFKADYNKTKEE